MLADQNGSNFPRLVKIMQRLLAPDGCPWDREQTLQTLRTYVIEEAYEVADAIDCGNFENLCEELGDLLLQVVFQTELARRQSWFGHNDVIDGICEKLIHRHPHVFGDEKLTTASEVRANWELLKADKKQGRGVLDGVPSSLPALLRALRVGQKAARIGLDWPDSMGVREKIDEELSEFDEAVARGDEQAAKQELGDVLFSLANLARKKGIDPETALRETLNRFTDRVRTVEAEARRLGRKVDEMSAAEVDRLWEAVKEKEAF
ncbi:MAG: nucleoside triphosphate pyrophosphohydrolase [Deltaproteobacteria bacterium]|nr:nucleoside triphosphate pyrophosphohydrolase [Deltaproteobacteria bacterium]